jgi:hypothetical protein
MEAKDAAKKEAPAKEVGSQLAWKTWSVIARFLHEGSGIVTLHKTWDSRNQQIILFPSYSEQDPSAMKPDVWMAWRHVLKAPLEGHTYIRDYADVTDCLPIQSEGALSVLDSEQPLSMPEARRRYRWGAPGLVALVLRVHRLSRSYKFLDVAKNEGDGEFVPLPFEVDLSGATPVLDDAEFERRRNRILSALGRA